MRLHLLENFERCGIARRNVRNCRSLQSPLDGDSFTEAGDRDLDRHTCLVWVVSSVYVGAVLFEGDVSSSLPRKTRHISSEGELKSVNHATLSRTVGTTDGEILFFEI